MNINNKMSTFIPSPRKYRPTCWEDVLGQDPIITVLRNEIINERLHNAYLFCGQQGVGKTTVARIFARAINCEKARDNNGNPCGECLKCQQDVFFELDAASNNSVDDVRNIIDQVSYGNSLATYNVFIIDEVHMLSVAAFNAFLKTLEEPPQKTIFILATTEYQKVPATIISRCQCFNFQRIPLESIVEQLKIVLKDKGIEYEDEALYIIAEKADGALRNALSMIDGIIAFCEDGLLTIQSVRDMFNLLDEDEYFYICDIMLKHDIPGVIMAFNNILQRGFSIQSFLDGLLTHFMNLLLVSDEMTATLLNISPEQMGKYKKQASMFTSISLQDIIEVINTDSVSYRISVNKKFFVVTMLIKIIKSLDENK